MTHEFKDIVHHAIKHQESNEKMVLATVVFLEGSSYRKPGVRMLISEGGKMTGAVSGGCVEKEVYHRASSVFLNGKAKVITYDGRYRLGCEGLLYILIEPFMVSEGLHQRFSDGIARREHFAIKSHYIPKDEAIGAYGSLICFENEETYTFSNKFNSTTAEKTEIFEQTLNPNYRLLIIGGEHDAVKLTSMASVMGWDVEVITDIKDPKSLVDFPGALSVTASTPETLDFEIDDNTAVVLMTHNYVQDLKFLIALASYEVNYIGILGAVKRREELFQELIHFVPEVSERFLETIHSPAGLHLGSITPEEIGLSILAEILATFRGTETIKLRELSKKVLK